MVLGMILSSSFGDFFPNAEYDTWYQELEEYYENQMTDAEKAELEMQDDYDPYTFSLLFYRNKGPVKPEIFPTEYRTEKTYKNLGSLMMTNDRLLAVDEAFKDAVESLEPGVHQFQPLTITMPKGKTYPKQYYIMVIRRFLDSFSPEQSDENCWDKVPNFELYSAKDHTKKDVNGLAMKARVFGDCHLWREEKLRLPEIFLSDALHAEVKARELRVPKIFQMKEV